MILNLDVVRLTIYTLKVQYYKDINFTIFILCNSKVHVSITGWIELKFFTQVKNCF